MVVVSNSSRVGPQWSGTTVPPARTARALRPCLDELREYATDGDVPRDTCEYVAVVSGAARDSCEEYDRLCVAVGHDVDTVLVGEIGRIARLGGDIHGFVRLCAEHTTSIEDREVGLSLDVDDSAVDRSVTEMIAGLIGSLAEVDHRQKLRRIRSGIEAARDAGRWTGRPPREFTVEDGYLRVDVEALLRARAALERVAAGDTGDAVSAVAENTGIPPSTLARLSDERADLYRHGDADDSRVDATVQSVRPLPEPEDWHDEVREIVREELDAEEMADQ